MGDHGADQEEEEDGVTEDLGQTSPTSTTTVAQLAGRLPTGVQLQQGLIPPPAMITLVF